MEESIELSSTLLTEEERQGVYKPFRGEPYEGRELLRPKGQTESQTMRGKEINLDSVVEEVGSFGLYQFINFILLFIPIALTSFSTIAYVFTTYDPSYRCLVPECELSNATSFSTPWLNFSVPFENDEPAKCSRYHVVDSSYHPQCTSDLFTRSIESCNEFVYKNNLRTIVNDFGLNCESNKWKRSIVGTIVNIGHFVATPVIGFISDRFGRKVAVIWGTALSTLMGVIRSFSPSYPFFVIFEFLDAFVSSAIYSGALILGAEAVCPSKRVLVSCILSSFYAVGEIYMGLIIWKMQDWRWFLRITYIPGLLVLLYGWHFPESLRWLFSKGKKEEGVIILEKIARYNKKELSPHTKKLLLAGEEETTQEIESDDGTSGSALKEFFTSKRLLIRLANSSFCWITNTFVFYGLSLNSVSVAGNIYVNFIFVSLSEIPGYFLTWVIMGFVGRRTTLFAALTVSGASCIAYTFLPSEQYQLQLALFFIGKMAITVSFSVLYIFSAEIYPTNARHFLIGLCSTFGRIGSMVAPLTPLFSKYVNPLYLFGGMSITSGLLTLLMPETLNITLPDTAEDAKNLGKKPKRKDAEQAT